MEADVTANKMTRKRMEDVAAERLISGDNSSPQQVDTDPICRIIFGDNPTGPRALLCSRDDALVNEGAAAPNPYLLPVKMRPPTAAGSFLLAGTTSTAMRTFFPRPLPSWTLGEEAEEITRRTNNNQLAPPYWRKVIQTKSRQTLEFEVGGCTGRLDSCPFLGGRYTLRIIRWTHLNAAMGVTEAGAFLVHRGVKNHFQKRTSDLYVLRSTVVSHPGSS